MPQVDIKLVSVADTLGFQKIEAAANGLKSKLAALPQALTTGLALGAGSAAFGLLEGVLKNSFSAAFDLAEEFHRGAQALGSSTDAYQVLSSVMKAAGGDIDQLNKSVTKTNVSLFEARNPASKAADAYRQLGLNAADLERVPLEKRLESIGKAFAGSKDQTAAFASVSEILGTKNLPVVLSAMQQLARDGYDNLSASMQKAGKIMNEDTIERLHEAEKAIAQFKKQATIAAGDVLNAGFAISESFKKDAGGTFLGLLKTMFGDYSSLAATVAATMPAKEKTTKADDGSAARDLAELTDYRTKAEERLNLALLEKKRIESDPNNTAFEKRHIELDLLKQEINLREYLLKTEKAIGEEAGESPQAYALKIAKQQEKINELKAQLNYQRTQSNVTDANKARSDRFDKFQEDGGRGPLQLGSSLAAGAREWVVSMGTASAQAADAMKNSLGGAVDGISTSLQGLILRTMTWGDALRNIGARFGSSMLQAFTDMVAKYAVSKAAMFALDVAFSVKGLALTIANAAKSLVAWIPSAIAASISSFGVAAAIGTAAVGLALVARNNFDVGGFTPGGPKSKAVGTVHAGEWVAPQWMVNSPAYAPLIAGLENARSGGGFSLTPQLAQPDFGSSGSGGGGSGRSGGGGGDPVLNHNTAFFDTRQSAESWLKTQDGVRTVVDIMQRHKHVL